MAEKKTIKNTAVAATVAPGKTTSEYKAMLWTSVASVAMAIIGLLVLFGVVPADMSAELKAKVGELLTAVGLLAATISSAGYSIGRGLAKKT